MAAEEHCTTRLLTDTPAENDAFGGHERVARSIVEVVQTEAGGRAIGLEGGWGAGKSTIVKLTSKLLTQTSERDYKMVVFDIWAHQDDPLRRTFLENVITRIQEFGWVDTKQWVRRLAELTRRRSEDTTRVVPRLTRAGIWFALTLLIIPVGSALISAGAALLASKSASETWALALLGIGIFGVLAPAIYYGIMATVRHCRRESEARGSEEGRGLSEFPALVTGQASTESRTIVTQTPDPTSVEFESIFRSLLDEALADEDRKLLLVIDNLDRVQPSDALSIWSTLQTFLGHSDYRQADWIDRLWVLIPYDGNAILRLWEGTGNDGTDATHAALATSFLEKTFPIRFRVPPLLLLNWRDFLQEALQQALPKHQEADFHDVFRSFAITRGLETSAPTPRDVKTFVNQIGTLHRARQDEFPLSHLACYVLLQKDGKNLHDALLAEADLETPSRIIGKQWREIIAALHFGVDTLEARQLLLRRPIEVALADGDGTTLSKLALAHSSGFWTVLEDSVPAGAQGWSTLSPAEIAKAATALADSHTLEHAKSRPEAAAVQSSIRTAASAVPAWSPFEVANAQGMVAVVRLVAAPEEIIPALIAGASNAPIAAPEGSSSAELERVSPSVWMASALELIQGLVELGFGKNLVAGIEVPLDAQQWFDVSHEVVEKDPHGHLLKYCRLKAIPEIAEMLAQRMLPRQIDNRIFDAVQAAMATKSSNAMKPVASRVYEYLKSGGRIESVQLALMLKILRFSKSAGLITEDRVSALATGGHYLHHLYQAASERHPQAVAECMFGFLEAVPDASEPSRFGNSNAGYQKLTQLLQEADRVPGAVEYFAGIAKGPEQLPIVFEMTTGDRPVPPFVARVLRTLLVSEDVSKTSGLVRANWHVIRHVLQEQQEGSPSFEGFLKGLPELNELAACIVDNTFDVCESGLYVALLRSTADSNFGTWCANGLSSVGRDAWSEEIASQGELVELLLELKTSGANVTLNVDYFDALIDYASKLAERAARVLPKQAWDHLFGSLSLDHRELFPRRAYDVLKASDGTASSEFFEFFGDMLSSRNLLANDQRLIDQVCRPILDAREARGIEWLAEIAHSNPLLLAGHGDPAAANDFKDRVWQRLNDIPDHDPTLPHLKTIARVLGIQGDARDALEAGS